MWERIMVEVSLVLKLIKVEYSAVPDPNKTEAAEGKKQEQGSVTEIGLSLRNHIL